MGVRKALLILVVTAVLFPSFGYADDVIIIEPGHRHKHRHRHLRENKIVEPYNSREGFFFSFDLGAGGVHLGGPPDDGVAFLGNLRIGTGISNRLLLMGVASTALTAENNRTIAISSINFAAQQFVGNGLYIRPSLGVAIRTIAVDSGTTQTIDADTGIGFGMAMGHEVRLGPWFAFSPEVDVNYSHIAGDNNVSYGFLLGFLWYL